MSWTGSVKTGVATFPFPLYEAASSRQAEINYLQKMLFCKDATGDILADGTARLSIVLPGHKYGCKTAFKNKFDFGQLLS